MWNFSPSKFGRDLLVYTSPFAMIPAFEKGEGVRLLSGVEI